MSVVYKSFWDFSQRPKLKWILQSISHKNVKFYWDTKNKAWCRRIDDVKCEERPDCHIPFPNQLVNYSQWKNTSYQKLLLINP